MLAGAVDALERLRRQLRALGLLAQHLGQADDGVERRAQLMAHIGEELRLVLARNLECAALLFNLAEEARVLDREHRLGRKGLQEIDRGLPGNSPGLFRRTTSAPMIRAEQRHDQKRAIARPQQNVQQR